MKADMRGPRTIYKPVHKKTFRLFGASQMSNTKWRKMFSALGRYNANVGLQQAIVKFIDDDFEHVITAPDEAALRVPQGYVDLFLTGPIALSAIEWIEYPEVAKFKRSAPSGLGRVPPREVIQDIDKAEAVIQKLGQYPLQRTARGLRISGYIRPSP
jgi:hypothetical protein